MPNKINLAIILAATMAFTGLANADNTVIAISANEAYTAITEPYDENSIKGLITAAEESNTVYAIALNNILSSQSEKVLKIRELNPEKFLRMGNLMMGTHPRCGFQLDAAQAYLALFNKLYRGFKEPNPLLKLSYKDCQNEQ